MDEGLARFRYQFPDNSGISPEHVPPPEGLRQKTHGRSGFQQVKTYADFQETHRIEDPDFFIHVAEKLYKNEERAIKVPVGINYSQPVETARSYYNSNDADRFYATVWGGEDIHIGLYEHDTDTIFDASRKTVMKMASMVNNLGTTTRVLDIGSGYGGSARYLIEHYGCHVSCLNLSETQNARNRELNAKSNYSLVVNVVDGNFEEIPTPNESVDVVWSQDAILHSGGPGESVQRSQTRTRPGRAVYFLPIRCRATNAQRTPCNPSWIAFTWTRWDPSGFIKRCSWTWGSKSLKFLTSRNSCIAITHESLKKFTLINGIC